MNIKRALISVYNKEGLEDFARFLYENNVEIISTGGTADYLEKKGIVVTRISDYTGFDEILDGRVKTLHPKLFGGILAKDSNKDHEKQLIDNNINKIDMVVINFYPFENIAENTSKEGELLENIDIGGFALLRAAAKNYRDVIPVVDPIDYKHIVDSIEECGDFPLHERRKLALKSFYMASKYDSNIHKVFSELFASEKYEHEFFEILGMLRYGSNPLQEAMLMKFAEKNSIFDYLENLTKHKSPTLRIIKDIKLCYKVASKTEDEILMYTKKGINVFTYYKPSNEDINKIINMKEKLRGGILYTDREELIKEFKDSKLDGVLTSKELEIDNFITYKTMVFKMKKQDFDMDYEFFIDDDLVVKQEVIKLNPDLSEYEKIGFEIAKIHKSDTIVYLRDNKIYSGVQSLLNRNIAVDILPHIVTEAEDSITGGTVIFDSPINTDYVIEKLELWDIEKVILPPALPKDEKYIEMLKEKGINVIVTAKRYHRY